MAVGEAVELALTAVTAASVYVGGVPLNHRRRHAEIVRGSVVTVLILARYHGRWILWQVTTFLPRKRG